MRYSYRPILFCIAVGILAGLSAELFLWLLKTFQQLFISNLTGYAIPDPESVQASPDAALSAPQMLWWLPAITAAGGLVSGLLSYRLAPEAEGDGADAVIRAYHQEGSLVRLRTAFTKLLASSVLIGSGGSAGREGPVAQIGAGIGSWLAGLFKLSASERSLLTIVGMAAGLAAVFKSPLGSALFAVKSLYSELHMETMDLGYAILGAAVAFSVVGIFDDWRPLFYLPEALQLGSPLELVWYSLLGLLAGILAAFIPTVFYGVRDGFRKLPVHPVLKPAIGGLLVGLVALQFPQVLAGGYGWIQGAINGSLATGLLLTLILLKLLTMSFSVGSGGAGGVFAPTLFIGAMLGAVFANCLCPFLVHAPPAAAISIVAMASVLAGAARVPLPALIMVMEMTGGYGLVVPTMVAVTISWLVQYNLSRRLVYKTLFESQVSTPADSPLHRREYCSTFLEMLRNSEEKLDRDLVERQVTDMLFAGEPVPLPHFSGLLYLVQAGEKSSVINLPLSEIVLPDNARVVSILRGKNHLVTGSDTRVQPGDWLAVVSGPKAMQEVRRIFSAG